MYRNDEKVDTQYSGQHVFLGSNVKFLRTKIKLSTKDLANDLGVAHSTISGLEGNNEKSIGGHLLACISSYFGVDVQTLLFSELDEIDRYEQTLFWLSNVFTSSQREQIIDLATVIAAKAADNGAFKVTRIKKKTKNRAQIVVGSAMRGFVE